MSNGNTTERTAGKAAEQVDGWVYCFECTNYSRLLLGIDRKGVRIVGPCNVCWRASRQDLSIAKVPPICDECGGKIVSRVCEQCHEAYPGYEEEIE